MNNGNENKFGCSKKCGEKKCVVLNLKNFKKFLLLNQVQPNCTLTVSKKVDLVQCEKPQIAI